MRLSYSDIERLAVSKLDGFMKPPTCAKEVTPVPIGVFAASYLRLQMQYTRLSDDGRVLGVTTYADTEIELHRYCRKDIIKVPAKTILLDESLRPPRTSPSMWGQYDEEKRRRNFTIAHECSHQVIFSLMPESEQRALTGNGNKRTYSLRELMEPSDWFEWQANAMAAALIMPARSIELLLRGRKITLFGKKMNKADMLYIDGICNRLGVSRTAMTLRLRQLGYAIVLPTDAYFDPIDIYCDDSDSDQQYVSVYGGYRNGIVCSGN